MADFFKKILNIFGNNEEVTEINTSVTNDTKLEDLIDVSWSGYYTK